MRQHVFSGTECRSVLVLDNNDEEADFEYQELCCTTAQCVVSGMVLDNNEEETE